MKWSPQQSDALRAVGAWLADSSASQVFRLFGFAGTGKTTLARHFAEGLGGRVLFAAYTGKAAHCLHRAGCPNACTIHSLIYRPVEKSQASIKDMHEELDRLVEVEGLPETDTHVLNLRRRIEAEEANLRKPLFELNEESDLIGAKLLVVDEVSMVDRAMASDILSFGVPVLALGDPFQLPPIFGMGYFTHDDEGNSLTPDVMLEEIHRQARDNPIIGIASHIRRTGRLPAHGDYGDSRIASRSAFDPDDIPEKTQVIVGRVKTRVRGNARRRRALGKFEESQELHGEDWGWLPVPGDRLMCLRNDHQVGLLNGAIWDVDTVDYRKPPSDALMLGISDPNEFSEDFLGAAHPFPFRNEEVPYYLHRDAQKFDYGYVMTCHKAQGSQWRDVLVVNESRCFHSNAPRWLYTAVTRAEERMVLIDL